MAETRGWSDDDRPLLLQCVLTGKAQEASASLSKSDGQNYDHVKAVLRAYESVPEAYRQRLRGVCKQDTQTHVEFVRDLETLIVGVLLLVLKPLNN